MPVGYYTFKVKAKDTMDVIGTSGDINSQGIRSSTDGLDSVEYTQEVRVIQGTIPSNLQTTCLTTYVNDDRQFIQNSTSSARKYGWFISDSNTVSSPPVTLSATAKRLGSTGFTTGTGTIMLDLMFEFIGGDITGFFPQAACSWTIYYRLNSSYSWGTVTAGGTPLYDTNQVDIKKYINDFPNIAFISDQSNGIKNSANVPVAFDLQGEYFIVCEMPPKNSNAPSIDFASWVNVSDANYPSCIPYYGKNMINGSGQDVDWFQYGLSDVIPGDGQEGACLAQLDKTVYARTPYSHVLTQFFETTSLEKYQTNPPTVGGLASFKYIPGPVDTSQKSIFQEQRFAAFKSTTQYPNPTVPDPTTGFWFNNGLCENSAYVSYLKSQTIAARRKCGDTALEGGAAVFIFRGYSTSP